MTSDVTSDVTGVKKGPCHTPRDFVFIPQEGDLSGPEATPLLYVSAFALFRKRGSWGRVLGHRTPPLPPDTSRKYRRSCHRSLSRHLMQKTDAPGQVAQGWLSLTPGDTSTPSRKTARRSLIDGRRKAQDTGPKEGHQRVLAAAEPEPEPSPSATRKCFRTASGPRGRTHGELGAPPHPTPRGLCHRLCTSVPRARRKCSCPSCAFADALAE